MSRDTDIAWAAGFFDGEGCVSINKRNQGQYYVLEVTVAQRLVGPLDRFRDILGIGTVYHTKRLNDYGLEMWTWRATAESGAHALILLLPYLFLKKEQAQMALAFQGRRLARGKHLGMTIEQLAAHRANDDVEYVALRAAKRSFRATAVSPPLAAIGI